MKFNKYIESVNQNKSEFFIIVEGFKTLNQAEIFADWYEGSGEQFVGELTELTDKENEAVYTDKIIKKENNVLIQLKNCKSIISYNKISVIFCGGLTEKLAEKLADFINNDNAGWDIWFENNEKSGWVPEQGTINKKDNKIIISLKGRKE